MQVEMGSSASQEAPNENNVSIYLRTFLKFVVLKNLKFITLKNFKFQIYYFKKLIVNY